MYKILENGQVMKQDKGNNFEQWLPTGSKNQVKITDNIYQWTVFSLELGTWVDDTKNLSPILIDGTEHIPINGKVEILL